MGLPALGLGQPGRILTASAIYTPFDGSSTSDEKQRFAITTIDLGQVPSPGENRHIPDRRPEVYTH